MTMIEWIPISVSVVLFPEETQEKTMRHFHFTTVVTNHLKKQSSPGSPPPFQKIETDKIGERGKKKIKLQDRGEGVRVGFQKREKEMHQQMWRR